LRAAIRRGQHLDQEHIAQARRLFSAPVNGGVELDLGNLEKSNHRSRNVVGRGIESARDDDVALGGAGDGGAWMLNIKPKCKMFSKRSAARSKSGR
jgi:hypothetical protein